MYESLLNFPGGLFAEFDRVHRDMDALLGLTGSRGVSRSAWPERHISGRPGGRRAMLRLV